MTSPTNEKSPSRANAKLIIGAICEHVVFWVDVFMSWVCKNFSYKNNTKKKENFLKCKNHASACKTGCSKKLTQQDDQAQTNTLAAHGVLWILEHRVWLAPLWYVPLPTTQLLVIIAWYASPPPKWTRNNFLAQLQGQDIKQIHNRCMCCCCVRYVIGIKCIMWMYLLQKTGLLFYILILPFGCLY